MDYEQVELSDNEDTDSLCVYCEIKDDCPFYKKVRSGEYGMVISCVDYLPFLNEL
jgi:hypothetical protein